MNISNTEYWKEIRDTARNLADESLEIAKDDNPDISDYSELKEKAEEIINDYMLHETVDGHQWVIYYAYNLDVIQYSDNETYIADNFGDDYLGETLREKGYNGLNTLIAYGCMYADVQDNLENAWDDMENEQ